MSNLAELVSELRHDLETELPLRLHLGTGRGKSTKGGAAPDLGASEKQAVGDKLGWTGLPYAPAFLRYLDRPGLIGRYDLNYEFIAAASIEEVAAHCRQFHHESHRQPEPTGSLCRRLVIAVAELRQPLAFAAAQEGIGVYAAGKHLEQVLKHAAAWRRQRRENVTARDGEAAAPPLPIEVMLSREHDWGEREWDRLRRRYPYLTDWETERGRRAAQHLKLGCACGGELAA